MKLDTIKLTGGLDPELVPSDCLNPLDAILAAEEAAGGPPMPYLRGITNCHLSMPARTRLEKALGVACTPQAILERALGISISKKDGTIMNVLPPQLAKVREDNATYLATLAKDRGWAPSKAEELASLLHVIGETSRIVSRAKGAAKTHRATNGQERLQTRKVATPDGKREWNEATVFELPPSMSNMKLVSPRGHVFKLSLPGHKVAKALKLGWSFTNEGAIVHEPAFYALGMPDGSIVNTRMAQGALSPKRFTSPASAMQGIATRLKMKVDGGPADVLSAIFNKTDIIASYMTIFQNNDWLVIVSYQRTQDQLSTLMLENGKLSQGKRRSKLEEDFWAEHPELDDRTDKRLKVSEVDYLSYTEAADCPVEPEETGDGEDEDDTPLDMIDVVEGGLVELEASITDSRTVIDLDSFEDSEDEDEITEMSVINTLRGGMDLSQFAMGSLGDLECRAADQLLEGEWTSVSDHQLAVARIAALRRAAHRIADEAPVRSRNVLARASRLEAELFDSNGLPVHSTQPVETIEGGYYGHRVELTGLTRQLRALKNAKKDIPKWLLSSAKYHRRQMNRFRDLLRIRRRLTADNDTSAFIANQQPGHWNTRGTYLREPVSLGYRLRYAPAALEPLDRFVARDAPDNKISSPTVTLAKAKAACGVMLIGRGTNCLHTVASNGSIKTERIRVNHLRSARDGNANLHRTLENLKADFAPEWTKWTETEEVTTVAQAWDRLDNTHFKRQLDHESAVAAIFAQAFEEALEPGFEPAMPRSASR